MVNVTLTRVRMARIYEVGRQDIAFDGFVRPVLLDDGVYNSNSSTVVRHSSKKVA